MKSSGEITAIDWQARISKLPTKVEVCYDFINLVIRLVGIGLNRVVEYFWPTFIILRSTASLWTLGTRWPPITREFIQCMSCSTLRGNMCGTSRLHPRRSILTCGLHDCDGALYTAALWWIIKTGSSTYCGCSIRTYVESNHCELINFKKFSCHTVPSYWGISLFLYIDSFVAIHNEFQFINLF